MCERCVGFLGETEWEEEGGIERAKSRVVREKETAQQYVCTMFL